MCVGLRRQRRQVCRKRHSGVVGPKRQKRLATLDGLGRPSMPFVHCWRCAPDKGLSRRMGCRGTYSCQYVVEVTSSGGKRIMAHVLDRMPRSNRKPNEASAVWSSWQAFSTGLTLPASMGSDRRKPPLAPHNPPPMFRDLSAMDTAGCRLCPWAALERNWSAMLLRLGDGCCRLAKMCSLKPLGWGYWSWCA